MLPVKLGLCLDSVVKVTSPLSYDEGGRITNRFPENIFIPLERVRNLLEMEIFSCGVIMSQMWLATTQVTTRIS